MLHLDKINSLAATSSPKNRHRMKKRDKEKKANKIQNKKLLAARPSARASFLTEEKDCCHPVHSSPCISQCRKSADTTCKPWPRDKSDQYRKDHSLNNSKMFNHQIESKIGKKKMKSILRGRLVLVRASWAKSMSSVTVKSPCGYRNH